MMIQQGTMEEIESVMYSSYFCRMKSEEIFLSSAMSGTYQIVEKIYFFSKRKHPPDRNLTQFDPSFLIHPCLAEHEGLTAAQRTCELVPCPFPFLPFQKI